MGVLKEHIIQTMKKNKTEKEHNSAARMQYGLMVKIVF